MQRQQRQQQQQQHQQHQQHEQQSRQMEQDVYMSAEEILHSLGRWERLYSFMVTRVSECNELLSKLIYPHRQADSFFTRCIDAASSYVDYQVSRTALHVVSKQLGTFQELIDGYLPLLNHRAAKSLHESIRLRISLDMAMLMEPCLNACTKLTFTASRSLRRLEWEQDVDDAEKRKEGWLEMGKFSIENKHRRLMNCFTELVEIETSGGIHCRELRQVLEHTKATIATRTAIVDAYMPDWSYCNDDERRATIKRLVNEALDSNNILMLNTDEDYVMKWDLIEALSSQRVRTELLGLINQMLDVLEHHLPQRMKGAAIGT